MRLVHIASPRHAGGIPVLGVALVMLYWLARVLSARRQPLPAR